MKKKLFGLFALSIFCSFFLSGCTAVQSYSLRSYQGPLPMGDYRYVNPDTYGVPTAATR